MFLTVGNLLGATPITPADMPFSLFGPSAVAVQALAHRRIETLAGLLPPASSLHVPTATMDLQPFSILPNISAGSSVLVLRHESLDPRLTHWLDEMKHDLAKIWDLEERAKGVFAHVARTFAPTRNILYNPLARWRELRWEKEPMVVLGQWIAHGVGACLPQAAALHLGYQALGISSKIVMGEMKEVCLDEAVKGEVYGSGPHAWVEAVIDARRVLYDPSQQVTIDPVSQDLAHPRKAKRSRTGTGETSLEYQPAPQSRIIGIQIPLTQDYLWDDEKLIRGALELYARWFKAD